MKDYFEILTPDTSVLRPGAAALAVDAVYCISLQEQSTRFATACAHLREIGVNQEVTFFRPRRASQPFIGCWRSHVAVARHCLDRGLRSALILEDDAHFMKIWPDAVGRINAGLSRLPANWRVLYVGHLARKAYFVRPQILRCMSLGTHAYVANSTMLHWLAETEPFDATIPYRVAALDGAFEVLDHMYALFPMLATQRYTGESFHHSPTLEWLTPFRLLEAASVLLSPWHRRTFPRNSAHPPYILDTDDAQKARRILASGAFDPEFYRAINPDIANAPTSPLLHYIRHGAIEGRAPNARELTTAPPSANRG